jgi:hypothetical protein
VESELLKRKKQAPPPPPAPKPKPAAKPAAPKAAPAPVAKAAPRTAAAPAAPKAASAAAQSAQPHPPPAPPSSDDGSASRFVPGAEWVAPSRGGASKRAAPAPRARGDAGSGGGDGGAASSSAATATAGNASASSPPAPSAWPPRADDAAFESSAWSRMALPTAYGEPAAAAAVAAADTTTMTALCAEPEPAAAPLPRDEEEDAVFLPPWRALDASAAAALPEEVKAALDACVASGVFGAAHAARVDESASQALVRHRTHACARMYRTLLTRALLLLRLCHALRAGGCGSRGGSDGAWTAGSWRGGRGAVGAHLRARAHAQRAAVGAA